MREQLVQEKDMFLQYIQVDAVVIAEWIDLDKPYCLLEDPSTNVN